MFCQACNNGDHDQCNMATWCQCDCGGPDDDGLPDFDPYDCMDCGMCEECIDRSIAATEEHDLGGES